MTPTKSFEAIQHSSLHESKQGGQTMYNAALKQKWDNQAVLEYAIMQGKEEGLLVGEKKGLLEGKLEGLLLAASKMKKMGLPIADIARLLELSIDEVEKA
jgi:predicted transposase/invertase (TIGR01784 family)